MNKKRLLSWTFLLLAATVSLLSVPVFASQAVKEYNESDKELNATYQKALAIITEPEDRRLFVEAQRAWIKYRDAKVAFHARYYPGSKGGLFIRTDLTQERTKELKNLLAPESKEEHKPFEDRK